MGSTTYNNTYTTGGRVRFALIRRAILRVIDGEMTLPELARKVRATHPQLHNADDCEVVGVVQPLIVVGELRYTPGLRIARAVPYGRRAYTRHAPHTYTH